MSVRQRTWTTPNGERKSAWQVDYRDQAGKRRSKTFARKRDAVAFEQTAGVEVRAGVHIADSSSVTVAHAGALWLASGDAAGLEMTTLAQRRQHLRLHIEPYIGTTLLSKLTVPTVRQFEDDLRADNRSAAMIRKVLGSLGSIVADAQERGLALRNPVREMSARRGGSDRRAAARAKSRARVGADIPTPGEMRAILAAAKGRWRPLLITATFTGMRASELRGLRWQDVDFEAREVHVAQRADRFNVIGRPKTSAGDRSIPLPPMVVNTLREWKLSCPRRKTGRKNAAGECVCELDLVFPNGAGGVENHGNILNRGWHPTQLAAGVSMIDDDGAARAKYGGLHSIRHFFASWCINRKEDGGLGLPAKVVQERLGHSSITMTMDTYGHLFPRGDDGAELAAAEAALLGVVAT